MARNIEIKARVDDPAALEARVAAIADTGPEEIRQDDTFFACAQGRLKLRQLEPHRGQLIAYSRADAPGPKLSDYSISETTDPDGLRQTLASACGVIGRVRKRRLLYRVGQTRVHLDRVEHLGDFMELEVVLDAGQSADSGTAIAHSLMARLGIDDTRLITGAYLDLLP